MNDPCAVVLLRRGHHPEDMKKFAISILLLVTFALSTASAAISWRWAWTPSDITASNRIAAAMDQAVAVFNTYSDYTYTIPVAHNAGVPTAQASYHGNIEFGGSIGYRVAMHEMCHWFGTGTHGAWGNQRQNGQWAGIHAHNAVQAYDGPNAAIGCDGQHYWPYGWNYDNEGVNPERLIGILGGFLRDMGIDEDRTIGFAPGTYSLRNRQTTKLLDSGKSLSAGEQVRQSTVAGTVEQRWILSLIPGTTYFTLRSVANGKLLDSLGNAAIGAPVCLASESLAPSQQWQVLKTDSGFYQIVNRETGRALSAGNFSTDGTGLISAATGSGFEQQWKFVHTTPPTIPAGLISQFRPATASSSSSGQLPANATDGDATLTRWTASGGSYPQWWRIDLGSVHTITNIVTYWYPGWTFKYRIEVSTNDVNYTVAVDATGNTVVGTTTNALSTSARYVRITSTGISPSGGWASFYDCQIFGTPQIPATPGSLQASAVGSRQIRLSWPDVLGAAGFIVKRSLTSGGPFTIVTNGVKGIEWVDANLEPSTTYFYVVSAVNSAGQSADSIEASATTLETELPSTPTDLTALPGHNNVVLTWAASPEATLYNVKRSSEEGGPYSVIGTVPGTAFTDNTAVNGSTYFYVVSATNSVGESADSAQVTASPFAVFAHWKFDEVGGVTALDSAGSRHGTLMAGASRGPGRWNNALLLNGTSTSYATLPSGVVNSLSGNFTIATWVYVNAHSTWARLFDFGTGTTAYMFLSPVSGGNTLRYAITTSGGSGEQQINAPMLLSPGTWQHVAVVLSGTTGTLYLNGVPIGTNSSMTLRPSNLGVTTLNYIGRSQYSDPYFNGRVDDFRIYNRALTGAELSALANPEGAPDAPTMLNAVAGHNQVALNWTLSPGAVSYTVKRSLSETGPFQNLGPVVGSSFTDTGVLNGFTYYYAVAAVNGAGEGVNSTSVAATPSDLHAHWKFNETSGTAAADSAGSNNGTLTGGASWIGGRINNAVLLNGSSGYVSLPAGIVSSLNDFSITTWVFVNANSTWARVFDFGTGTGTYMFLTPQSVAGTIRYAITTGGSEQQVNGTAALTPGQWNHVAITLNGTTGILYVNGVAIGTNTSMTLKPSGLGNTTLNYIGKSQFSDPYLNGRVDDFRIYRRALTASEISTLFTAGGNVPLAPAGLTAIPGDGQVQLNWNGAAGATVYRLKRSTSSSGPFGVIASTASTASIDSMVTNGVRFFYVVSAANIVGESGNSAAVEATPSSLSPVDLAMSVSGGVLNFSWPADHIGWRLQVQINSLAEGLSTNWVDVPDSHWTNILSVPMNPENDGVFYRLIFP